MIRYAKATLAFLLAVAIWPFVMAWILGAMLLNRPVWEPDEDSLGGRDR